MASVVGRFYFCFEMFVFLFENGLRKFCEENDGQFSYHFSIGRFYSVVSPYYRSNRCEILSTILLDVLGMG